MKEWILNILRIVIGLILIIIIFYISGFNSIIDSIRQVAYLYFFVGFSFYIIRHITMTWTLNIILKNFRYDISFLNTFKAHMGGIVISDYTPSRTGYLYASLILRQNENIPLHTGLSSIISSNAVEFTFKVVGAISALFYLIWIVRSHLSVELYLALIFVTLLMLSIVIIMILVLWWERASNLLSIFEKIPYLKKILQKIQEIQAESKKLKPIIWKIVVLSFIVWILKGLTWFFFFISLGINKITLFECMLLQPLVTAFSFIPLFPSGIGVQEVGMVFVLGILSVPPPLAIAFDLLLRSTMLFNILGLFFALNVIRASDRNNRDNERLT